MSNDLSRMRPALRMRLCFIECLLLHYGTINRGAVMDMFDMSAPMATRDLQHYLRLAPNNMTYDLSARTYRREPAFVRLFDARVIDDDDDAAACRRAVWGPL